MSGPVVFAALGILVFLALVLLTVTLLLIRPWLRALMHGVPVSAVHVLAMRLRGTPPVLLIDALIALRRLGVPASMDAVERVYIDNRNRVAISDDLVELVKKNVHPPARHGSDASSSVPPG